MADQATRYNLASNMFQDGESWHNLQESGTSGQPITLNYCFLTTGKPGDKSALGEGARDAVNKALDLWESVCGVRFVEVPVRDQSKAHIVFKYTDFTSVPDDSPLKDSYYGYGNTPPTIQQKGAVLDSEAPDDGDDDAIPPIPHRFGLVRFNSNKNQGDNSFENALHNPRYFRTIIHEIGHALGLQDRKSDASSYDTIMSNKPMDSIPVTGFDDTDPSQDRMPNVTPMAWDILAMQKEYGKRDANTDNTNYGNSVAYDWTDSNETNFLTIWDTGGEDTIDFSKRNDGKAEINLSEDSNSGGFAKITVEKGLNAGRLSVYAGIAFDTVIENAVGTDNEDVEDIIQGNWKKNKLEGKAGTDYLYGGAGDDELHGGEDKDYLYGDDYKWDPSPMQDADKKPGADKLYGGAGEDELYGGDGDDRLYDASAGQSDADADSLYGGKGFDTYFAGNNDTIKDSDGKGAVEFLSTSLSGGIRKEDDPEGEYKGNGGTYNWTGGDLTFTKGGKTITVEGFKNNDLGISLEEEDEDEKEEIDKKITEAKSYTPPRDPFVLDLDGDGIETINLSSGILFDHNADSVKTGTGWIKSDDGLLVRDLNNNGTIDNGRELFGDQTLLTNGQTATNGFAALRDLDSNKDGILDASDTNFAQLKVWQDLNQDGISQAEELKTLEEAGITSIALTATTQNQSQSGNTIASTGIFTRANGTTGTTAEVNLAINTTNTEFTDDIEVPETLFSLPNLPGSGHVRNLQQAAALSPSLASLLQQYAGAPTRDAQLALLDQLLLAWADTSDMAKSLDERASGHYNVEYLGFGSISRSNHLVQNSGPNPLSAELRNEDNPLIDETYRNLIESWNNKIHILESFSGSYFFQMPGKLQEGGGAATGLSLSSPGSYNLTPNPLNLQTIAVSYAQQQLDRLNSAYDLLKQSLYADLLLKTRLQSYLDLIERHESDAGISLDFTQLSNTFRENISIDPKNGLSDLIEFNKYTRSILSGTEWDGISLMEDAIRTTPLTTELEKLYRDLGVSLNASVAGNEYNNLILGDSTNRNIYGNNGNDILLGGSGSEIILGGSGSDTISGGGGDDTFYGGYGNDTYIFRKGNGNDFISDARGKTTILLSGLNPSDIKISRGNVFSDEVLFIINETGESLRVSGGWFLNNGSSIYDTNRIVFADGTVWEREEILRHSIASATDGDDSIIGCEVGATISGAEGDDTLIGGKGKDIIDGGAGDDTIIGSPYIYTDWYGEQRIQASVNANSSDIYLFGRGDGHDVIIDGDTSPVWENTDVLRFKHGVAPSDVSFARSNTYDLVLTIKDTGDSVTIRKYFQEEGYWSPDQRTYEIERIEFTDNTVWTAASIGAVLMAGTEGDDTISGYRSDDTIIGGSGNDTIDARTGNDTIRGGDGNDVIRAGLGDDTIDGGAGNDTIYGSDNRNWNDINYSALPSDNDTYLFGFGDGHDTITGTNWYGESNDTIRFKEGVSRSDVTFHVGEWGGDLVVALGDGSDTITISNWFIDQSYQIKRFEFEDGSGLTPEWINSNLTVLGTEGNDNLTGSYQNETLQGFAGNDTITADNGKDTLDGGTGDDILQGGEGGDTYRFGRGYGRDTVIENSYTTRDTADTIELLDDLTPDNVIIRKSGDNMVLTINGTEDKLIATSAFSDLYENNRIEEIRFSNGTVWDFATMKAKAIEATDGDDTITAFNTDDTLNGKAGNDTLKGGYGSDTYLWGRGQGNDTIREEWGDTDRILISEGLTANDLSYAIDQQDLVITIKDTGETLRVIYGGYSNGMIERLEFADSTIFTWQDVRALATASPTSETVIGTPGDDTLIGTDLDNTILGLEGSDLLVGGGGIDIIEGGDGDDTIIGGKGRDNLSGGTGANTYVFEKGTGLDYIRARIADEDSDTIHFADDITPEDIQVQLGHGIYYSDPQPRDIGYGTLVIGRDNDVFEISRDAWQDDLTRLSVKRFVFSDGSEMTLDQILAMNDGGVVGYQRDYFGTDNLVGSNADDSIYGREGNDTIRARGNNDYIDAGAGNDSIDAGSGDDVLYGGTGDDLLRGGKGDDSLDGGTGKDTYLFNRGDGNDYAELSTYSLPYDGYSYGPPPAPSAGDSEGDDAPSYYTGWSTALQGLRANTKTLSMPSEITLSDLSVRKTDDGEIVLLLNNGSDGSITIQWVTSSDPASPYYNPTIQPTAILAVQNLQFIGNDGAIRTFDLQKFAQDRLGSITSSDAEHTIQLSEDAGRYDITYSTLPVGGDSAVAYAQTGDMFGTATYTMSNITSDGEDRIVGAEESDTINGGNGNDLIYGNGGDDTLYGGDGKDRFDGGTGNDTIYGEAGDDLLVGGDGDDNLHAGTGRNISEGGFGNDTYYFNAGDGNLTIEDSYMEILDNGGGGGGGGDYYGMYAYGYDGEGEGGGGGWWPGDYNTSVNVLQFGPGITVEDLHFSNKDGYLVIDIPKTGDQVRLAGYNPERPTFTDAVDIYRFSDGTEATPEQLIEQGVTISGSMQGELLEGTPGNDILIAGYGDDGLLGKAGDDRLEGGAGDDVYLINRGDGVDTIVDISTTGLENTIQFGYDITSDQLRPTIQGNAFVLELGEGDALKFEGYDPRIPGMAAPVGRFLFDDGTEMTFEELMSRGYEILGTPEQDSLRGTDGNDRIRGLASDDDLTGGAGNDTYLFSADEGTDTIHDLAAPGAGNMVMLPDGSAPDNISLSLDADKGQLIITSQGTGNILRLDNFDRLDPHGKRAVELFQFGPGGQVMTYDELLDYVGGFDIRGTAGNDRLPGTSMHDLIQGGAGNDTIEGGTGDDNLQGGSGDDTYLFNKGDGEVYISDFIEPGAGNTLRFGPGIAVEDIQRHLRFNYENGINPDGSEWSEGELIIAFDNGDTIHLNGFNRDDVDSSPRSVDTFRFDDGTVLSFEQLARMTFVVEGNSMDDSLVGTNLGDRLYGHEGDDSLNSGSGDDVLTGGVGNDDLLGSAGRDTYVFNLGNGNDTIIDAAENGTGNIMLFGPGINRSDIALSLVGTTLTISYGNMGDTVTVENFDPTGNNGTVVVDSFQFDDGSFASYSELINQAPVIETPIENQVATQGQLFSFTLPEGAFVDPDGDQLGYVATVSNFENMPEWLKFDSKTRTLYGTPANGDVGSFTVTVGATDFVAGMVSQSFNINVENVNDAPELVAPITDRNLVEDQPFSFVIPSGTFRDIDKGDKLTLAATLSNGDPLPEWLAFDTETGTFSGTPGNNVVGAIQVTVTATDLAGASIASTFGIETVNSNDAPTVAEGISTVTATEDAPFAFTIPANAFSDIDKGDKLAYTATLANGDPLPEWLTFDSATSTLTGNPGNDQVGSLDLLVIATDEVGETASTTFVLNVANANDAPVVVTQLQSAQATEDLAFSYIIPPDTFKEIDKGDTLILSAALANGSPLPTWLTFDAATGTLTGNPGNDQVGTLDLLVTATDKAGATVSTGFSVNVANVNDAPVVVSPIADQTAKQGQAFTLAVPSGTFKDIDKGDALTVSSTLANGTPLPAWLTFDAATGTFSGTPAEAGTVTLSLTATDLSGAQASDSFDINVAAAQTGNKPPVATPDTATLTEDRCPVVVTGNVLSNDRDPDTGDKLKVTGTGFKQGDYGYLGIASNGLYGYVINNLSYDVQSLGRATQVTDHFGYTVTDGKASTSSSLDITIKGTNDAPIVARHLSDQSVKINKAFAFAMATDTFRDIDKGDALTYTATLSNGKPLPSWLKFDAKTGTFSGTAPKNSGYLDIKVTATDKVASTGSTEGSLSVSDEFRLDYSSKPSTSTSNNSCQNNDNSTSNWPTFPKTPERIIQELLSPDFSRFDRDRHDHNDHHDQSNVRYLDCEQMDEYLRDLDRNGRGGTDRDMESRWQMVSDALRRELSSFDRDFTDHRRQSGDFSLMGNDSGFGFGRFITDNSQLTAGSGTCLKEFKGLGEGFKRI